MAKKVGKIAKEKKPFDKTYIPLTFAIILLVLLLGALVYVILTKPKDKPVINDTNTLQVEDVVIDNKNTVCSNDELKALTEEAKKITAKYEEIDDFYFGEGYDLNSETEEKTKIYGYALRMTLEHISPNLQLVVSNDLNDKQLTYYELENDYVQWDEGDTFDLRQYYVDVYANTETCKGVKVRSFDFVIPKWNEISKLDICKLDNWKEKEICKHFTYDERTLAEKLNDSNQEAVKEGKKIQQENKKNENIITKVINNKTIIIIAVVVGIIGVVILITILVMKGRKKDEK